jgi:hypothetical protein
MFDVSDDVDDVDGDGTGTGSLVQYCIMVRERRRTRTTSDDEWMISTEGVVSPVSSKE